MAGKARGKRRRTARPRPAWWPSMGADTRRRLILGGLKATTAGAVLLCVLFAAARMRAYGKTHILERFGGATLALSDLPPSLAPLAEEDLRAAASDLLTGDWLADARCRDLAESLRAVGWIRRLESVRRLPDARFEVRAEYRHPAAMVQHESDFLLVDADGVRLPGTYRYSPAWMLIQGVARPAPAAGLAWEGDDLAAALALVAALRGEPFEHQITAVLVDNLAGRLDPSRCHIELATDRAGGRIRWGSAPGYEVEENSVAEKLAILRENHRRFGRADGNHAIIDVSAYPDRFIVPE